VFYILHGNDEFTRKQEVAKLKERVSQAGLGGLNVAELDGRQISLRELMEACSAMPFLSDRRLVIVEDMLQRYEGAAKPRRRRGRGDDADAASQAVEEVQRLLSYLPQLPPTTRLVFSESKPLDKSNPVLAAASEGSGGYVREYSLPKAGDLRQWIRRRAADKGVEMTGEAVELLAASVGDNLRLLDVELEKLAAGVGYVGLVGKAEVKSLVSAAGESDVFALVDALGMRQTKLASLELARLLATGASELYVLAMIARQARLVLATKDLLEVQGLRPEALERELGIRHRFIVDKLARQARQFELEELQELLRRVLEADQAIKTGTMEGPPRIELLVVEACASRGAGHHQRSSA